MGTWNGYRDRQSLASITDTANMGRILRQLGGYATASNEVACCVLERKLVPPL